MSGLHRLRATELARRIAIGEISSAEATAAFLARIVRTENPMGRAGEPHEVAGIAVLLCGEASSYITGENVRIDGSAHMPMQG